MRNVPAALRWQFAAFGALTLASLGLAIYFENIFWLAPPVIVLVGATALADIRALYFLLLACLPLSIEMELPGGFGTDFPDELLMVGLMFLTAAYLALHGTRRLRHLWYNPIALLLVIHFAWIVFSVVNSSLVIVSFKFMLAKIWYLVTFVLLTSLIIRKLDDFKKAFWCVTLPLLFTVVYTLIRHAREGFTFLSVNHTMAPFFRNHVSYAAMLSEWLPFVWLAAAWYARKSAMRNFVWLIGLLFTTGLIFSFTRGGWLAVLAAIGMALVVRYKLTKPLAVLGCAALLASLIYVTSQYRYMALAPKYEKTIYHEYLGEHLTSTVKMEDISSAERVYRWVAGFKMWEANPAVGFGPGNFYNFYKSYTVRAFRTYVSRNPERSTVHNYFLLLLVEQGIGGVLIFIVLTLALFIYGEKLYHCVTNKSDQRWVLAIIMSLTAIYVNNSLSDMIETDKVGSVYFIDIAMLMWLMHKYPPLEKTRREHAYVVA